MTRRPPRCTALLLPQGNRLMPHPAIIEHCRAVFLQKAVAQGLRCTSRIVGQDRLHTGWRTQVDVPRQVIQMDTTLRQVRAEH